MSHEATGYRANYERKENYAGEKQKQLRHGKYVAVTRYDLSSHYQFVAPPGPKYGLLQGHCLY